MARFVFPVSGQIGGMVGDNRPPNSNPGKRPHKGYDIGGGRGTPIVAAAGGTVTEAKNDPKAVGAGRWVEVTHEGGYATRYLHLDTISVAKGAAVAQGQQVGTMGDTGSVGSVHLHFEIWDKQPKRNAHRRRTETANDKKRGVFPADLGKAAQINLNDVLTRGLAFKVRDPMPFEQGEVAQAAASPFAATFLNQFHVLACQADGAIVHARFDPQAMAWTKWSKLNGSSPSTPGVIVFKDRLHVIVRGTDNNLWHRWVGRDGKWQPKGGWDPLPGATPDAPTVGAFANQLHVVVRGTDNGVYHNWSDDGITFQPAFERIVKPTDTTGSQPAVAVFKDHMHIVVRGLDNGIYHTQNRSPGPGWTEFRPLDGSTCDAPALGVFANQLHVITRGVDDGIYHNFSDDGLAFQPKRTRILRDTDRTTSPPAMAVFQDELHIFVRGADDGIYRAHTVREPPGWTSFGQINGSTGAAPTLAPFGTQLHVMMSGKDGRTFSHNWCDNGIEFQAEAAPLGAT
jgi:hypothetical protein